MPEKPSKAAETSICPLVRPGAITALPQICGAAAMTAPLL
jgi:hypothetical protein